MKDFINVLDLCAGYGGLSLGLKLVSQKFRTICYVEKWSYAQSVLVARMEEQALDKAPLWDDCATFDGSPWRSKVDCIVAGYPCQPFSAAGKLLGSEDDRYVWPQISRIIAETNPTIIFLENVANHLSFGFREIASELHRMDYTVAANLFAANEIGAPHQRERLFILANANSIRRKTKNALSAQLNIDWGSSFINRARSEIFPPLPTSMEWKTSSKWMGLKPALRRKTNGTPQQLEQLHLLGNGVVPQQAAFAFLSLWHELNQNL